MGSVYFQVMSDLHLETHKAYNDFEFATTATHLALLGDIGRVRDKGLFDFLERQLQRYTTVYFLLGNHEPYHMSIKMAKAKVHEFSARAARRHAREEGGQFVFLDQIRHDVSDSVTVLGCTLFSQITAHQAAAVDSRLVDFDDILRWTVEEHNDAHKSDLDWLNKELLKIADEEPHRRVVIFTHHSPCVDSRAVDHRHRNSEVSSGFVTDLSAQPCWTSPVVTAWAFGHTHYNCSFTDERGKRVLANQKGYYLIPQKTFDSGTVLKVGESKASVAG